MKNKKLLYVGLAILIVVVLFGRSFITSTYYTYRIIGEWTIDAYEAPPMTTGNEKVYLSVQDLWSTICKNRSYRYEFSRNLELIKYYDNNKTVESGNFRIEGDNLIFEKREIKPSKGKIPTGSTGGESSKIIRLSDEKLILESTGGFRLFFVKSKK